MQWMKAEWAPELVDASSVNDKDFILKTEEGVAFELQHFTRAAAAWYVEYNRLWRRFPGGARVTALCPSRHIEGAFS